MIKVKTFASECTSLLAFLSVEGRNWKGLGLSQACILVFHAVHDAGRVKFPKCHQHEELKNVKYEQDDLLLHRWFFYIHGCRTSFVFRENYRKM